MARDTSGSLPDGEFSGAGGSGDVGVQELTWALLDEQINDDEFHLLETMLLTDDTARSEYLDCIQLHVDLMAHFAPPAAATTDGKTPVLGFLGGGAPSIDVPATN